MILYKYLQPERLNILKDRKIRFTQPGDFNDPFEFRPRIATAMEDGFVRKYVEENFDRILEESLAKYGGALFDLIPREVVKPLLAAKKNRLPEIFKLLDPSIVGLVSPWIDNVLNANVGVLCLSAIRDSLLM